MPRPNWFFAFPVDGHFVLELPEPPPSFRRFHPDDVHCTVSFLGGCGEAAAMSALAALDRKLAERAWPVLEVTLGDVVPMGPRGRYSALSALLGAGRNETEAVIAGLRDALSEAALGRREKRAPKAHITLARPGRRASEASRKDGLTWAASLELQRVTQRLERVALYTWHPDRKAQLFQIVAERALLRSG